MAHNKNNLLLALKLTLLIAAAFTLTNCANIQPTGSQLAAQSNPLLEQAQAALSQRQFSVAGQLFFQLANASQAAEKDQHLLSAFDAYTKAGDSVQANELMHSLLQRASSLSPNQQLALAQTVLDQGKAERANQLLDGIDKSRLTIEQRIYLHTISSSAFFQAGNLIESARERVIMDPLISQADAKLNNQTRLVETLSLLSEQALNFMRPSVDNAMAGWIDLAIIVKKQTTFEPNSPDIIAWESRYPSHAANTRVLSAISEQALRDFITANKVGVFLPTEGPYASAAHSIRQGIVASAYAMAKRWRPNITYYDTSSSPIEALYDQAIKDGIDVIIGPLDKANAAKITAIQNLSIPVISLNQSGTQNRPNYFEFSLSPEEDVSQVLSLAWLKGYEKALILTPQSNYGERLASHFSRSWQQLGGDIVGVQTYDPLQVDFSVPIKNLLQLDESINRFKKLRQRLNLNIKFEERRRHDADFIFLLSSPREGRLIKPQLRFHRAADLAVFSTSRIYEGEVNTVANRDLDEVLFCDMPWLIEPIMDNESQLEAAIKLWPKAHGSLLRLVAFGYDAYQLVPHLKRLRSSDFARFKGKTGIISINNDGLINRQLSCGRFNRGVIKSLGLAPQLKKIVDMPPATSIEQAIGTNTNPL